VIPFTGADSKDTMGLGLGNRAEYGLNEVGQNGWAKDQLASAPSGFGHAFPSVDDLDSRDWLASTRHSAGSLSSVSTGLPGPSSGSGQPPSTASQASSQARPFEMDAGEIDREKEERAAAMAKLQGSPPPNQFNGLPPGVTYHHEVRASAPASVPSRGPLPLAPPKAKGSFSMPITDSVVPGALWQYLNQPVAKEGKGPRVLLLDVRTKEEYDRGSIKGEVVCLEPAAIRQG